MFRGPTSSMATSRVRLQMSMFGDPRARRRSMSTSCSTLVWWARSSAIRSSTMSFTLLSDCELRSPVYVAAAARTAVGAELRETRVQAASYETAALLEESMAKRERTKRAFWAGSRRHTLRVRLRTQRANPSPNLGTSSTCDARYSMARPSASLKSIIKALRLAAVSVSFSMNCAMSSGPSGSSRSPKAWWMYSTVMAAFLRTYEWRCSRHSLIAGTRGSKSSGSFSLQR
mmetsp:Transcript_33257/g.75122  ORF Transcript_33257/g.75122 Transcript_33257/m.75122 type:complete len:230 (+) Transcript_33257:577-1266(+)